MMRRAHSRAGAARLVAVAVVIALIAAACKSHKTHNSTHALETATTSTSVRAHGGTVTWAEQPGSAPSYIFPIVPGPYFSVANISDFQALMYRPLYWFGNNNKPSLDADYGPAVAPVYSDGNTTVTIRMRGWKWSDGETVSARDVVFFLNLLKQEKQNYGAYLSGLFPDNVVSYSTPDDNTVVLHLDKSYNPFWFTYNQLSELTPLPLAWDRTSLSSPAPTSDDGHLPDATPAGAKAVYAFLSGLATKQASYAKSPIWSVVDGPWKLDELTTTGQATFVPNPTYSGPSKPTIDKFVELPFTSDAPEVNLARTGPSHLTIGSLPASAFPQKTSFANAGYNLSSTISWSFSYFVLNMHNPKLGPVFRQLYFRQAFQHLIDQKGWLHAFNGDIGAPTDGVVPANPPNDFVDAQGRREAYPFDIDAAKKLLTEHGWNVKPDGVTTCRDAGSGPSQCGDGVAAGTALSFNLDYQSGRTLIDQEMRDLKSNASRVGIDLELTTAPFNQVYGKAVACKSTEASCAWTAENWGGGWIYVPDIYPTGEELFATGAVSNQSNYSDPKADRLIAATTTASQSDAQDALNAYADYMHEQLPVVLVPITPNIDLVSKTLGGFSYNACDYLTPEQWFFTK